MINNTIFMQELQRSKDQDRCTEALGKIFLELAEGVSKHRWFNGYSYREDMVSHGVERLCSKFRLFNPEVSQNPHAYFSKLLFKTYPQFLDQERRQSRITKVIGLSEGCTEVPSDAETIELLQRLSARTKTRRDKQCTGLRFTRPKTFVVQLTAEQLHLGTEELEMLVQEHCKELKIKPDSITWRVQDSTVGITIPEYST